MSDPRIRFAVLSGAIYSVSVQFPCAGSFQVVRDSRSAVFEKTRRRVTSPDSPRGSVLLEERRVGYSRIRFVRFHGRRPSAWTRLDLPRESRRSFGSSLSPLIPVNLRGGEEYRSGRKPRLPVGTNSLDSTNEEGSISRRASEICPSKNPRVSRKTPALASSVRDLALEESAWLSKDSRARVDDDPTNER